MNLLHAYYLIKPGLPRRVQIVARKLMARYKRRVHSHIWPINPNAFQVPEGWTGWPGGKRFALVLQHDVDTKNGLKQCTRLMDLEKQHDFRSAFFFVPEGYYTPPDLRKRLTSSGFEVGVHGLRHDGRLFKSPAGFRKRFHRVDYYLKEWEALGFTSPSMLRDFDLMGELDIEYGCSSFDTDPFEPQSKGASTIFPFVTNQWPNKRGYLELPYTLPQDHGLFVILGERDNRIWKEKLDWIAAKGGMASLITHPDYMNFDGGRCNLEEYPVSHYADLLAYIKSKYSGQYWHALPREMAAFWKNNVLKKAGPKADHKKNHEPPGAPATGAKIWIDLDNATHVPFFLPLIKELKRRGHRICLSADDAFQVCELSVQSGLPVKRIGHHYGKNPVRKAFGLIYRSIQLISFWRRHRPEIAISHGARSQALLCRVMRTPTIFLAEEKHSRILPIARPKWMLVPEAVSIEALPLGFRQIRQYPGTKEDVYVPSFGPDPALLKIISNIENIIEIERDQRNS